MRTPLYGVHRELGARFVEFAGWELPLRFRGIVAEHQAVRTRAGLFDVSHMGEIEIRGSRALEVCQELTTNDVARLRDGHVQYTLLCLPSGGVLDDVTLHRLASERYLFCVNAANTAKDLAWLSERARGRAEVIDRSAECAQLALQGPAATSILGRCTRAPVEQIRPFRFAMGEVSGVKAMLARTGYTGEDGWELYCRAADAVRLWHALLEAGSGDGLLPAGLGARDTLRIERGLCLYGHELDENTTPLEAGLDRFVYWEKEFVGREALLRQREARVTRRLVGVVLTESGGVPRPGYAILRDHEPVGAITSGAMSPTLGKAIGLGYARAACAQVGLAVRVQIRKRPVAAAIAEIPFYRRPFSGRERWNFQKT